MDEEAAIVFADFAIFPNEFPTPSGAEGRGAAVIIQRGRRRPVYLFFHLVCRHLPAGVHFLAPGSVLKHRTANIRLRRIVPAATNTTALKIKTPERIAESGFLALSR